MNRHFPKKKRYSPPPPPPGLEKERQEAAATLSDADAPDAAPVPPQELPEPNKDEKGTVIPEEGIPLVTLWVDKEGRQWLNDGGQGPEVAFNRLTWAMISVLMPFFYREMIPKMQELGKVALAQSAIHVNESMIHHLKTRHGGSPIEGDRPPTCTEASPEDPAGVQPGQRSLGLDSPKSSD